MIATRAELFHVIAASRWQRLRLLALPSSLPFVFAALKIAAPLALLGALIAEWMGGRARLGGNGPLRSVFLQTCRSSG